MAIPDYETIMLPLLKFLSDRQVHLLRESINMMATEFDLTDEERTARLPSGVKRTFDDRVSWASTYMKKAALLNSPKRGLYQITERGLKILQSTPNRINNELLLQFPEFKEFRERRTRTVATIRTAVSHDEEKTPEELLENGYLHLRDELASELLQAVKECSPAFFEDLVVDL
jgi:restriction system protein